MEKLLITGQKPLRGEVTISGSKNAAVGRTTLTNIQYIDRGYEDMVKKFTELGARIERFEDHI